MQEVRKFLKRGLTSMFYESIMQRATSNEQRATSNEQRATVI
ncbi:Uncharacterised protein [Enterococcus cecorum]|nr:Uncharacterised protein [Enterococcus cecorum]